MMQMIIKRMIAAVCCTFLLTSGAGACTSAIISARLNPYGRPMLWKHRDTSNTDNKIEYVPARDGDHAYVALFNAADRDLHEAWTGINDAGFAVMNTASYNIKDDDVPEREMDREGFVMTIALRSCRTVDDFARLLDALPRPLGVEANFGVIDATGAGAFFETNNDTYVRYDLADAPGGLLIRTNYSHSGRPNEGYGFIREANAGTLLAPHVQTCDITPELLTEEVSRSFYHSLMGRDMADGNTQWVVDQDFIPRYKSTATIVIEGCIPVSSVDEVTPDFVAEQYVMWTGLGYPPVADIVPVWCSPDGVEDGLRGIGPNGTSPIGNVARKRRDEVFPRHYDNGDRYIDMTRLVNEQGTGYLQTLPPLNRRTYERIRSRRDRK